MPLIGQVKAVGRTHPELEADIADRYARGHFLQEPKVTVAVVDIDHSIFSAKSQSRDLSLSSRPQRTYGRHDCWWPDLSWTQGYRSDPARRPAGVE